MLKEIVCLPQLTLIGMSIRTNNSYEKDSKTANILPLVQRYTHEKLADKIPNRKKPRVTYSVYTDYDSDEFGDYTYFIGELVADSSEVPEEFTTIIIPKQTYVKWTNGPAAMPDVCIRAWQDIWSMSSDALGGLRTYTADFEIYDERAQDPKYTELDIYIGITR